MTYPYTADDFGLHESANAAIIKTVTDNVVQRVSVLVNFKTFPKVAEWIKAHPGRVEWGSHFNLIEGKPISDPDKIKSLLDKQGNFFPLPIFLIKLIFKQINEAEIEQEIWGQYRKLKSLNINITHLNSHQHTHMYAPVARVVAKLARVENIVHVRQESSVIRRLKKFPIKLVIYLITTKIINLGYVKNDLLLEKFEENSIHPGTNYD